MVKSLKAQRSAGVATVPEGLKFIAMKTNIKTIVYIKEKINAIFGNFGYSWI